MVADYWSISLRAHFLIKAHNNIILYNIAGALLRPKNGYLVWSRGASSARART